MVLSSWETSVTAAPYLSFMVANTSLPDIRGTGATSLPHRLVSGITLEEAVAVTVIGPVVSRFAGREFVGESGRRRSRRHSREDGGEDDGYSWEMHFDL